MKTLMKLILIKSIKHRNKNYNWQIMIYARLSYNSNNWQKPSGPKGKSKSKSTFEAVSGFGFEEWIFDFDKQIDGYHYGYIEGFHENSKVKKYFDKPLKLYTLKQNKSNRTTKYFVASIKKWEYVSFCENRKIIEQYNHKGWIEEMMRQLHLHKLDLNFYIEQLIGVLDKRKPFNEKQLFNIRFKIKECKFDFIDQDLLNSKMTTSCPAYKAKRFNLIIN